MKRIIGYFLQGLVFVIPIAITIGIFCYVIHMVDQMVVYLIPGLEMPFPGGGFVLTLVLVTGVGFLASNIVTRRLLGWIDLLFTRIPFAKLLYSSVKDMIGALMGNKSFHVPAVVTLSPTGAKVLGFVTSESLDAFGIKDHVAVYVPQAYNFAGNLILFPKDQVSRINAESSRVMAFVVSGGVSVRPEGS